MYDLSGNPEHTFSFDAAQLRVITDDELSSEIAQYSTLAFFRMVSLLSKNFAFIFSLTGQISHLVLEIIEKK